MNVGHFVVANGFLKYLVALRDTGCLPELLHTMELKNGDTMLHIATRMGRVQMVEIIMSLFKEGLIDQTVLSIRNNAGNTPLDEAKNMKCSELLYLPFEMDDSL